ncbi:MAG: outer membrane lipoprotein carrier protein LolA [Spirochaetaceae bacterium]|nr:outer membrane lipoprotein carrier protein LolA [Spirochaetaceae bacterium]
MKIRGIFFTAFIAFSLHGVNAQIVTAEDYLKQVSNKYAGFSDFEAKIRIRNGSEDMYGTLSHRAPAFLKIEFTSPADQMIIFTGDRLTVYLPGYRAILNQSVSGGGAGLATSGGLTIMRRNFAPSYITGPEPTALEDSGEKVVKLRLTRRLGSEGFRELILAINPSTLLIRRITATTVGGGVITFDFTDIKTNIGMPETRFIYDSPGNANVYNNFLYRDTE